MLEETNIFIKDFAKRRDQHSRDTNKTHISIYFSCLLIVSFLWYHGFYEDFLPFYLSFESV